jgi:AcrR family transcriptional regulator
MSSTNSNIRILDAALALIQRRKGADVSMAEIAKASRLSRQAVYLHFADRADLMLALVRYAHEKLGAAEQLLKLEQAANGVAAMKLWVSLQARTNPRIWSVARSLEVVRRTDEAAERGWQDRLKHRLEVCRRIVTRMHNDGALKRSVTPQVSTELLWSITSLRAWEDLVLERGWTASRYEERITTLLCDALVRDRK